MKPTSLIFLALAAVLLFTGWFTCSIAASMADAQGISIYEQSRNKKGDIVYVYNLSDQKLNKLTLNFENVNVTVVGSAKSSYVELKNFDTYDYSTKLAGGSVTVDGTISGLSSFIDMSGGGLRFKGLRYFFADKPIKGHKRSVTVYISDASSIEGLNITLKNGNITLKNIWNENVVYSVSVNNGDVTYDQVVTTSVINTNIDTGDLNMSDTKAKTFNANVSNGKIAIDTTNYAVEFVSYKIKTTNSTLTRNDMPIEEGRLIDTATNDVEQCLIQIEATDATVVIKDGNSPITQ